MSSVLFLLRVCLLCNAGLTTWAPVFLRSASPSGVGLDLISWLVEWLCTRKVPFEGFFQPEYFSVAITNCHVSKPLHKTFKLRWCKLNSLSVKDLWHSEAGKNAFEPLYCCCCCADWVIYLISHISNVMPDLPLEIVSFSFLVVLV